MSTGTREYYPWGNITILVVITILMLFSITTIVIYNLAVGSDRAEIQAFRFMLTCWMCWFLYHGRTWARWVTIMLLGIAVLSMIPTLEDFNLAKFPGLYLLIMTLGYALAVSLLLGGPGIRDHFTPKQEY